MALIDDDDQPALRRGISAAAAAQAEEAIANARAEENAYPALSSDCGMRAAKAQACGFAWGGGLRAAPQAQASPAFPRLPSKPPSVRPLELIHDGAVDRYFGPAVGPTRRVRSPLHAMVSSSSTKLSKGGAWRGA